MIKVNNLKLSFPNKELVDNLSFELNKGDFLGIIGENGAGKSTLIQTIVGLRKIESGSISYEPGVLRKIGYLSQSKKDYPTFPCLVKEVIASGCLNQHRFGLKLNKTDEQMLNYYAEMFNFTLLLNQPFINLSKGQQQIALLIRALCGGTETLVLDEPRAPLDKANSEILFKHLLHLNKKHKLTIIMVTHNNSDLAYFNKILVVKPNYWFGTQQEYIAGVHK
jgi:zinc transport system ATP-binding protein